MVTVTFLGKHLKKILNWGIILVDYTLVRKFL